MKKIKQILLIAIFGAMSYGAFSAFDYMTMTETERMMLANVEALTQDEPGGGDFEYYTCYKTFTIWTESDFPSGSKNHYACVPGGMCELYLPMVNNSWSNSSQCRKIR